MAKAVWMSFVIGILMSCCHGACAQAGAGATAVQIIHIDEASAAADSRFKRLNARLDQLLGVPYSIVRINADIRSPDAIRAALAPVADQPGTIVLAGSGVMADAAISRFSKAAILFASHHDPVEFGLLSSPRLAGERRTGFSYDVNSVPQILSILARANIRVKKVGIVGDRFLAPPWIRRIQQTRSLLPGIDFQLFEVNNDNELEKCFASTESRRVDVWILLEGVPFSRQFGRIREEIERRKQIGIFPGSEFVEAGGLMSYEATFPDPFGIWARQASLIARGVPVHQIPVETPAEFIFSINLDAARRIGLTFTPAVIKTATNVFGAKRPAQVSSRSGKQ